MLFCHLSCFEIYLSSSRKKTSPYFSILYSDTIPSAHLKLNSSSMYSRTCRSLTGNPGLSTNFCLTSTPLSFCAFSLALCIDKLFNRLNCSWKDQVLPLNLVSKSQRLWFTGFESHLLCLFLFEGSFCCWFAQVTII